MPAPVKLKKRPPADAAYHRPPRTSHAIVPDVYADVKSKKDANGGK
jgi:hypothetical protein